MHANTAHLVGVGWDQHEPQTSGGRRADEFGAPRPPLRRILVVEDDNPCWRTVERILRSKGWRCEHAMSVAEARALLRGDFDAVFIDLDLGDGGRGEDVLALLDARHPPVAIVVLSGCGTQTAANVIGLGSVPYIDKLAPFATLLATLDEEVELTRLVVTRGLVGLVAKAEKGVLRAILAKLRATGGNCSRAAFELGLPRSTLRDKVRIYGLRSAAPRRLKI